jgi:hypothetical protein
VRCQRSIVPVGGEARPKLLHVPQRTVLQRVNERPANAWLLARDVDPQPTRAKNKSPTVRQSIIAVAVRWEISEGVSGHHNLGEQEPPAGFEPATCRLQGIRTPLLAYPLPR